jgi:hypothetical protein
MTLQIWKPYGYLNLETRAADGRCREEFAQLRHVHFFGPTMKVHQGRVFPCADLRRWLHRRPGVSGHAAIVPAVTTGRHQLDGRYFRLSILKSCHPRVLRYNKHHIYIMCTLISFISFMPCRVGVLLTVSSTYSMPRVLRLPLDFLFLHGAAAWRTS